MALGKSREEHWGAAPSLCHWVGSCGPWCTKRLHRAVVQPGSIQQCGFGWKVEHQFQTQGFFLFTEYHPFSSHTLPTAKSCLKYPWSPSPLGLKLVIQSTSSRNECLISQMKLLPRLSGQAAACCGSMWLLQCMCLEFHWVSCSSGSCSSSLQIRESEEFVSDFSSDTKLCKHSCCR